MTQRTCGLWMLLWLFLAPFAQAQAPHGLPDHVIAQFGTPPPIATGPLTQNVQNALATLVGHALAQSAWDVDDAQAFEILAQSADPRLGWILTDMLRFSWRPEFNAALSTTARRLLDIAPLNHRTDIIDHLIAWNIPTYTGYLDHKARIFTHYVPGWERIFTQGDIDWHLVSWGGVMIDDRPYGETDALCQCIPAIDDPPLSTAAQATWLYDDDIVFGIEVNGEYRAYPRRIMEVREMVNDTLGGRDLAIPYCTLCGAAQAFFTDDLPNGVERPIMRTSGLLIRSNKVMFDVNTFSIFDTFLGRAVTGPLADIDLQLDQASVITTQWGLWRAAHPETTVLVEDLALGRDFDLRNTRDAHGPIFPIGDADPRLPVHEDVVGVIGMSGTPIAFVRSLAIAALQSGQPVEFEDIHLELEAGGLRATNASGADLGSHQAFWFAWSQFHPNTALWPE